MNEAEKSLDRMLTAFEAEHATSSAQNEWDAGVLRQVVESSPELKQMLLEAIDRGALVRLSTTPPGESYGALATYRPDERSIEFSTESLVRGTFLGNRGEAQLLTTFAHEAQHALDAPLLDHEAEVLDTIVDAKIGFGDDGNRRDHTETAEIVQARQRLFEATAEIAAINVLAAQVRARDPDATLFDLYKASPETMEPYLDVDRYRERATPKPGLQFDESLLLRPNEANIEAVGRIWYDDSAIYPLMASLGTAAKVSEREAQILDARREEQPQTPTPILTMDFEALTGMSLPELRVRLNEKFPIPIFDPGDSPPPMPLEDQPAGTRQFRAAADATASHVPDDAPAAASPAALGHPDHDYFQLLRDRLPATVPDTVVAEAMFAAKQSGMTRPDQVDAAQIGLFDGTIWIGGHVPGFRASMDIDQARTDMREIARDLAREDAPHRVDRYSPAPTEIGEAAMARGR